MRTNLKSEDSAKQLVINYLEENASEVLVEKINKCGKTIDDCWSFIVSSAKKRAKNNCACISDQEVFGWAVHYYEEEGNVKVDNIQAKVTTSKPKEVSKPKVEIQKPKEEKPRTEKHKNDDMLPGQMTIFDLMGV